ncbi:MAG TPA: NACHT domain-containing protein [Vicinamibacteria bacterium]|nr:NACHT domain-containing protein [Vicinamibacteria bacterium]
MVSDDYRDMFVSLWADETPGLFSARALEEFGRSTPRTRIYLPFDDRWFVQYADHLGELNARELHYVGARLFDSLFQGDILRLYIHLLDQVRSSGARLRITLAIEPSIVARLPWECLYDTKNGVFASAWDDVALVRYVAPAESEPPLVPLRPPLRVLVVAEAEAGSRLAGEALTVRSALAELESEASITVFEAGSTFDGPPLDPSGLEALLARDFDVLHWIGKAEWDGTGASLALGDHSVDASMLGRLLARKAPCLVVWSGEESVGAAGPALAEALLSRVPALVAHRRSMPAELLFHHTMAFYRAVARSIPLDAAIAEARSAAMSQAPSEGEWIAPALFLARRDACALYNSARGSAPDVYQMSEGRYRRKLRETLDRFWPKPERYFPQSIQWTPRQESLASYLQAPELIAQPQKVAELSRRFHSLWIVGAAGTGKTMALYRLFYEAAQPVLSYESKSPLPLYLAVPDLADGENLLPILADGVDPTLFESDLEEGRFLFLLDSIDGLSETGAARFAQALNRFIRQYPLNRFVAASRTVPSVPLDISNRAELRPLSAGEALDFLGVDGAIRSEVGMRIYSRLETQLGADAGNPQLLAFARRIEREGTPIPPTATEIFLTFFRIAGASMGKEISEGLLPRLAYLMSRENRISLTTEHLEAERRTGCLRGVNGLEDVLTAVEKTRLLRGPRAFSFPNLAFQEFLTAYSLRSVSVESLSELVPPADWHDGAPDGQIVNKSRGPFHGVMPFLCGLRPDGPQLVEHLLERDLVLASICFRETRASASLDLALRAAVERGLASRSELEQRIAVTSLEARADAFAVHWLEAIARREGGATRPLAIAALGNLHSRRSEAVLESASADRDPLVARTAADALARITAS